MYHEKPPTCLVCSANGTYYSCDSQTFKFIRQALHDRGQTIPNAFDLGFDTEPVRQRPAIETIQNDRLVINATDQRRGL